jgi:hypothetical protein
MVPLYPLLSHCSNFLASSFKYVAFAIPQNVKPNSAALFFIKKLYLF